MKINEVIIDPATSLYERLRDSAVVLFETEYKDVLNETNNLSVHASLIYPRDTIYEMVSRYTIALSTLKKHHDPRLVQTEQLLNELVQYLDQ